MFPYKSKKANQAATRFVKLESNSSTTKLKLMKLLYILDRECIKTTLSPCIGGDYYSMRHGPVNSPALNESNQGTWEGLVIQDKDFSYDENTDPGVGLLSDFELEVIEEISTQFKGFTPWQLRQWTHEKNNIPEYIETASSQKIFDEDLLDGLGLGNHFEEFKANAWTARAKSL
jgi:uncharacterized phage-associated protein